MSPPGISCSEPRQSSRPLRGDGTRDISRSYFSGRFTNRGVPRNRSTGGSSGWAASVTPASSATGMTSARKRCSRSQVMPEIVACMA